MPGLEHEPSMRRGRAAAPVLGRDVVSPAIGTVAADVDPVGRVLRPEWPALLRFPPRQPLERDDLARAEAESLFDEFGGERKRRVHQNGETRPQIVEKPSLRIEP